MTAMLSGPHLDAYFSAPEPRTRLPRRPVTRGAAAVLAAFVVLILGVAATTPALIIDPRPGLIGTGGGIGQPVLLADDTALLEVTVVQAEWLPAPSSDDRLRLTLRAVGRWGITNLNAGQFVVQDRTGLLHGAEQAVRPDSWVQSFLADRASVQGTVDYLLPRDEVRLVVFAKNTQALGTIAVPEKRDEPVVVPVSGIPIHGIGQPVELHRGQEAARVTIERADWSRGTDRGDHRLTLQLTVTAVRGTVWMTPDWFALADARGDRHPVLGLRWQDTDGRWQDRVPIVAPGAQARAWLTFESPDRTGLLALWSTGDQAAAVPV